MYAIALRDTQRRLYPSRNTICFGLLLGTDTLPFAYILKRRAAKCVPHMRLDNAPANVRIHSEEK